IFEMEIKLSSRETGGFWEIPVLYEDEHLLAVNKPVGMAIAPVDNHVNQPNLIGLLHKGIADAKPWAGSSSLSFLIFAHRLDQESGGVLLLAKRKDVLTKLSDFFGSERHALSFITLVSGAPAENQFTIDAKIGPNPAKPGVMQVNRKFGKRAL